jgi:hypothetical protein
VFGGVMLVYNLAHSHRYGVIAGDNPWDADSLEWSTSSPPPVYNFAETPLVEGRHPMWQRSSPPPVVVGVRADRREMLVTGVMDAEPAHLDESPEPSIWPFLAAVTTSGMFVASIFTPWAIVYGSPPIAVTLIGWFWPKKRAAEEVEEPFAPHSPDPIVPEARA